MASDTAIGVVRARVLARARALDEALAGDAATPLGLLGGALLWLLRLALAPASTLAGFRAWVVAECPVAPGHRAPAPAARPAVPAAARGPRAISGGGAARQAALLPQPGTKTRRFLDLVTERHGPLAGFPLADVARVSAGLASEAGLYRERSRRRRTLGEADLTSADVAARYLARENCRPAAQMMKRLRTGSHPGLGREGMPSP